MQNEPPLEPQRLDEPRPKPSGGAKRKQRNQLPQVFLVVDKQAMEIIGAFLLVRVVCIGQARRFIAVLGGYALLANAIRISNTDKQYHSAVFKVKTRH